MGILFGLLTALGWGLADFLARFATRRIGTYRTSLYTQFVGLLGLTTLLALVGPSARQGVGAGGHVWAWLLLAGLLNIGSTLALYRSFEVGVLAVVAPIAASYPALTVVFSVLSGETLRPARGTGLVAAVVGVVLAATSFVPNAQPGGGARYPKGHLLRGVPWAILASFGFSVLFWLLGFRVMPHLGGAVSVWGIRLIGFSILAILAAPTGQNPRASDRAVWWLVGAIGLIDTSAFVANNLALKAEQVAVASVLASLYGAVTTLLAAVFLRERLERSQWLGIGLIFIGVILVSH